MSALSRAGSSLQPATNSNNNMNRRNRRRNRRSRRFRRMPHPEGIFAGYGSALTSSFLTTHRGDGCRVRGLDLVTTPLTQGLNISYFITANPVTWAGTRISAVAQGFQNYRPEKFIIHYRPQVGSTSNVSVFIGTIWQSNSIYSREAIEPSLLTSPGGTYLPAWQSSTSIVPLGAKLPQRMFPIRDPSADVVPFAVVARSSAGGPDAESIALPGRIFIEYDYIFDNAIGSSSTSQLATITEASLRDNQPIDSPVGWIVDYTNRAPNDETPLFAHLSWDYMSTDEAKPKINGRTVRFPGVDPVPIALVYNQGPASVDGTA